MPFVQKVFVLGIVIVVLGLAVRWPKQNHGGGQVKGIETVRAAEAPNTLLPVEHFNGNPMERSVADMLKLLNVTVYPEDVVKTFPDPALGIGSTITTYRATPVTIEDGGTKTTVRTWVKTIKDLLAEKSIELGDRDRIEPGLDTELSPNMTVDITRVTIVEITKLQPIAFKTIAKDDANLDKGTTRVERQGQRGEKLLTFQVTRENGKEVNRKLIKTEKTKDPVDEIILKGTKEVVLGHGKATFFAAPALSGAHNSLPRGTMVEVINLANGKSVIVKIIGGGIKGGVLIDLSPDAFRQLAPLSVGIINVKIVKP